MPTSKTWEQLMEDINNMKPLPEYNVLGDRVIEIQPTEFENETH